MLSTILTIVLIIFVLFQIRKLHRLVHEMKRSSIDLEIARQNLESYRKRLRKLSK